MRVVLLLFATLFVISCDRPMKDPHLADPVYYYYKKGFEDNTQEMAKLTDEIKRTNDLIEKAEPQTGARRALLDMMFEHKQKLSRLDEHQLYLQQKMKERIQEVKTQYMKAYQEKRPWPDKKDHDMFQIELNLQKLKGKEWLAERRIKYREKPTTNPSPASSH